MAQEGIWRGRAARWRGVGPTTRWRGRAARWRGVGPTTRWRGAGVAPSARFLRDGGGGQRPGGEGKRAVRAGERLGQLGDLRLKRLPPLLGKPLAQLGERAGEVERGGQEGADARLGPAQLDRLELEIEKPRPPQQILQDAAVAEAEHVRRR